MMLSIICLVFTYIYSTETTQLTEFNETKAFLSINAQLSELRTELKLINDSLKEKDVKQLKYYGKNCAEATLNSKSSGIYEIVIPSYSAQPFEVTCDAETQGGNWTLILRRMDGSVNFYRNWKTYKNGFGDLDGEFFLGLDKIHALTAKYSQELLVVLEDHEGLEKFEKFEKFAIGDEAEQYELHTLGEASGTAGNSFAYHHTMKFSTFDRDNDIDNGNCAERYSGAWWYKAGHHCNLAGTYNAKSGFKGVHWGLFHNREYSLKKAVMMIRPRKTIF